MNHILNTGRAKQHGVSQAYMVAHPGMRARWTQFTCPCRRCVAWRLRRRYGQPWTTRDWLERKDLTRHMDVLDAIAEYRETA